MEMHDPKNCKWSAVEATQFDQGHSGGWISRRPGAWLLIAGAYLLGGGGMLAWIVFLLAGPRPLIPLGSTPSVGIIVDTLLCLTFFVQHSSMVRRRFRLWLVHRLHAAFHGAFYAMASGTCLLLLVMFWQPVGTPLWNPPPAVRWCMLALFFAAGLGAWWGARSLGEFDALGVRPALQALNSRRYLPRMTLRIRGPYRWVRHPLYLFSLIIIWMGPVFTLDRLLHNGLWTLWIVVGATLEERDLATCFGAAYRDYREKVPMLLPGGITPRLPDDRQAYFKNGE